MSSCKDCLHSKVCKDWWSEREENLFSESNIACRTFADRSEWVHLPCKVGDRVWYLYRQSDTLLWDICETEVYEITLRDDGIHIYVTPVFCGFLEKEIGKKLFLTREEAEKALKEKYNG